MATAYGGFAGQVLYVDLGGETFRAEPLPDHLAEQYLGGKALAARLLWDLLEPGIDPLSPANALVVTAGPMTGSGAPASSRFNLSTKNVLTGGICSSNSGGDFGIHLKRAGYDALVIQGRATRPVWLEVDEHGVRFLDARHLWGLDTEATQAALSPKVGHMVIGPAGENLVRYSCIMVGERVLGRGGVGAVMGSKLLKVITVSGARRVQPFDREKFKSHLKKWVHTLRSHSITGRQLPRLGTAGLVSATNATCTLPTRNFQRGQFAHAEEVSGEEMARTHLVRNDGCSSCPIRCGRVVRHEGREIKGPEFETVGMLGPNIENRDLTAIFRWNHLADRLGVDTISLGSTIATAMELKDKGLLPELPVGFGDCAAMDALIEDVAWRRGVGDQLAEGSMRLAARHGRPDLAMHSKGMEFAAYEPRAAVGHGLGYAVSNRGGCHLNGGYLVFFEALGPMNIDPLTPLAKPALTVFQQNTFEAVASAGGCIFTTYAVLPDLPGWMANPHGAGARVANQVLKLSRFLLGGQGKMSPNGLPFHLPLLPHSKAVETLTGIPMKLGRFSAVGERGYTLERMFNLREGLLAETDALPPRLTDEPQRPALPNSKVPLKEMLPVYYQVRDWTPEGIPSPRLLQKLSLGHLVELAEDVAARPEEYRARRRRLFELEGEVARQGQEESRRWQDEAQAHRLEWAAGFDREQRTARALRVRRSRFVIAPERCRKCGECARQCPVKAIDWQAGGQALIRQADCIRCGRCQAVCPRHFDAVVMEELPIADQRGGLAYSVVDDKCKKCGICWKHCPVQAITWEKGQLAWIDPALCVACGRCHQVCPPKFDAILRSAS
jgi:aldehyde:ferredoxin oxidoreductase